MATANFCKQPTDYVSKILTEKRKAKKPLMEKMRRARINDSLNELKSLILEALNKDASRYSKMEKADVLEMTVQYLRELKRTEKITLQDVTSLRECRTKFAQCAPDLTRKLTSFESNNSLTQITSRCQGYTTNTTVHPMHMSNRDTLQYMRPLPQVMIPFPSPPPSPLHVSPSLPASRGLTADNGSVSPASTGKKRKMPCTSSRKHKATAQSSPLWRPW